MNPNITRFYLNIIEDAGIFISSSTSKMKATKLVYYRQIILREFVRWYIFVYNQPKEFKNKIKNQHNDHLFEKIE